MEKKVYVCPFCDSHISKEKYEQVIRENETLKKKIEGLEKEREQLKEKEKRFKEEKENDVKKARADERKKAGNQLLKYESIIKKQAVEIENLKKGKTAQELGFDFENEMYELLKEEFPTDDVQHTGKKGDAIIYVKAKNGRTIGTILIECKKTERHTSAHIDEVKRHKIDAKADVGILVTNADFGKTKMDGFKNIDDILIIRPFSAIDFIKHIRKSLLDIDSLKITKEEKNKEMNKLWDFIHSSEFESQMNSILRLVNILQELDTKELDLVKRREVIENSLLKAHKLISEGIQNSKIVS